MTRWMTRSAQGLLSVVRWGSRGWGGTGGGGTGIWCALARTSATRLLSTVGQSQRQWSG